VVASHTSATAGDEGMACGDNAGGKWGKQAMLVCYWRELEGGA
jgi:hypothetical protein